MITRDPLGLVRKNRSDKASPSWPSITSNKNRSHVSQWDILHPARVSASAPSACLPSITVLGSYAHQNFCRDNEWTQKIHWLWLKNSNTSFCYCLFVQEILLCFLFFLFLFFFFNIEIGLNSMLFKQQIGMLIKGQTSQPHIKQLPTKVFTFHFKHGASDLVRQNLCELRPLKKTPANSLSRKGKVTNVSGDSLTFLLQSLIFDQYGWKLMSWLQQRKC